MSHPRWIGHVGRLDFGDTVTRLVACIALMCMFTGVARSQIAPAGNEHPQTQALTMDSEAMASPFGPAEWPMQMPPQAEREDEVRRKVSFAKAVDLSPLRSLSVYHNGRVKTLESLARETVQRIAGRPDYVDFPRVAGKQEPDKVRHDPLFTLLDLVIDPVYYADKALIHVNFLPLREEFLEAEFPNDPAAQERWKRVTRLTPAMVGRHLEIIARIHGLTPGYSEGLGRLQQALGLVDASAGNMVLVASARKDEPWRHLATLPEESSIRQAALRLGTAWRAMDADGVNREAKVLAEELPKIHPEVYSPRAGMLGLGLKRSSWEMAYVRVNAFEWGAWLYLASLLTLLLAFGTGRKWLIGVGVGTLTGAMLLHGFGFWARCIIAERFAIQNQFESMTGVSLFAAIVGMGLMLARRQWLFGAAAAGAGFLVLITATQTGIPGVHVEREAAILNTSVLLKYHVTTVLTSYGLMTLAFVVSLFYLGTHYFGGSEAPALAATAVAAESDAPIGRQRTLRDLDTAQMTILQLAFWTLGVGILLGAWWADHSWGRWWAFDPKETWALVTWIVLLIIVHVRQVLTSSRALATAWLSVVGFFVMLWTYFGVNLLLPGLHAYA